MLVQAIEIADNGWTKSIGAEKIVHVCDDGYCNYTKACEVDSNRKCGQATALIFVVWWWDGTLAQYALWSDSYMLKPLHAIIAAICPMKH